MWVRYAYNANGGVFKIWTKLWGWRIETIVSGLEHKKKKIQMWNYLQMSLIDFIIHSLS